MKIKISFLNNISAAIILACVSLSACGLTSKVEDDPSIVPSSTAENMHSEKFYELKEKADGEKITYNEKDDTICVGFERTGDNEIKSYDGNITRSFEYKVNKEENTITFHVTTVNNSDEDIILDCCPFIDVHTDLSDRNLAWPKTTVLKTTNICAGSSVSGDYTHMLEEGWTYADISVSLKVQPALDADIIYGVSDEVWTFEFNITA